jgi:signal peptidase II
MLFRKITDWKSRLIPLCLTAGIMIVDQVSKILTVQLVSGRPPAFPGGPPGIKVIGDFFRILFVQNTAIAFSIGSGLPAGTQRTLFGFLPIVVIGVLLLYYLFTRDPLTRFQRWCFAALVGGGLGNFVDRIFRPAGVVDFLDFPNPFHGLFGLGGWIFRLERWPTFNLADSTVVVTGILLFISFLIPTRGKQSEQIG